tara:strand:- start:15961 stop:16578 length:618 start_codon:yes stop_codon:yes gene_type:complete
MNRAQFWDKVADKYAARPVSDEASYAATLDIARAALPFGSSVIEWGCGTGSTALRLAPDVGQFLGTDVSGRMIEIAKQKASDAGTRNVTFQVATAQSDVGSEFDAVIAFNLLHLLDDVPLVLSRAHKSLKTGGVLITKSACLGAGAKHLLRIPIGLMRILGKAPMVAFHSAPLLDQMVRDAGFEIESAVMLPEGSANRLIVARKV